MVKLFVGGSLTVRELSNDECVRLDREIEAGTDFLIGDASGVDTLVQTYLHGKNYRNVTIYAMNAARNNTGTWPVKTHKAHNGERGSEWYAVKDRAMDADADQGYMIWNGLSSGTRNNILHLLANGKPVTLSDHNKKQTSQFILLDEFVSQYSLDAVQMLKLIKNGHNKELSMDKEKIGTLWEVAADKPPMPEPGHWHKNWFSNMNPYDEPRKREDGLLTYTSEHDYQLARFEDEGVRHLISELGIWNWKTNAERPREQITGHMAKKFVRKLTKNGDNFIIISADLTKAELQRWGLPPGWEAHPSMSVKSPNDTDPIIQLTSKECEDWQGTAKLAAMKDAIDYKYAPGTSWSFKLHATNKSELVEWNNWGDTFWGRDIRTGKGENILGISLMEKRETNRRIMETLTLNNPSPLADKWVVDHVLGKRDATTHLKALGDRLRSIDPTQCNVTDVAAYKTKTYATTIGTTEPTQLEYDNMKFIGYTLGLSNIIVRSGRAKGSDLAAEEGAFAAGGPNAIEIVHAKPRTSDGSHLPGHYVFEGHNAELQSVYNDFCRGVNDAFDTPRMSEWAKALVTRDPAQVAGKDGTTISKIIVICADEKPNREVEGGTRYATYYGRVLPAMGFGETPPIELNLRTNREATIAGVIRYCNQERERKGLEALPTDWGPSHPDYVKHMGLSKATPLPAPAPAPVLDLVAEEAANHKAQASARELMILTKKHYADLGLKAAFNKVESKSFSGELLFRNGDVIVIGSNEGNYAMVDIRRAELNDELYPGSQYELTRNPNGLVVVSPGKEIATSRAR